MHSDTLKLIATIILAIIAMAGVSATAGGFITFYENPLEHWILLPFSAGSLIGTGIIVRTAYKEVL